MCCSWPKRKPSRTGPIRSCRRDACVDGRSDDIDVDCVVVAGPEVDVVPMAVTAGLKWRASPRVPARGNPGSLAAALEKPLVLVATISGTARLVPRASQAGRVTAVGGRAEPL